MRKLLALLLSVLMLASSLAAIPAFAADEANETDDGTTKDTPGLNKIIITEIGRKMYYHTNRETPVVDTTTHPDAMNFVEIYNNGAGDVELTDLSLVLGVEFKKRPGTESPYMKERTPGRPLCDEWSENRHSFISEMEIKGGALLNAETAQKYIDISDVDDLTEKLYNDYLTNEKEDMTLSNGEIAAIWFVTPKTIEWLAWGYKTKGANFDPKAEFLKSAGVPADNGNYDKYKVVMVWAYSDYAYAVNDGVFGKSDSLAKDMFNFENVPDPNKTDMNYILGVAKSTWNVDEDQAYTENPDKTKTINEDLYCVSVLGSANREAQKYAAGDDSTVTYAPATAKPVVQNAQNQFIGDNTTYTDYFDAGIVKSYRETGVIHWMSKPTPGMMPDWQWAIIDPTNEKAPAAVRAEGGADAAIQKYLKEDLLLNDDGSNAGRDESGIKHEPNLESQEDLLKRFQNTKKNETTDEEGGLATWALILIIVGGVLVVAGGACAVVFLVILPKKKAAAAASVGEAPAEDAPVEEAPVEETPAAEDNKEE